MNLTRPRAKTLGLFPGIGKRAGRKKHASKRDEKEENEVMPYSQGRLWPKRGLICGGEGGRNKGKLGRKRHLMRTLRKYRDHPAGLAGPREQRRRRTKTPRKKTRKGVRDRGREQTRARLKGGKSVQQDLATISAAGCARPGQRKRASKNAIEESARGEKLTREFEGKGKEREEEELVGDPRPRRIEEKINTFEILRTGNWLHTKKTPPQLGGEGQKKTTRFITNFLIRQPAHRCGQPAGRKEDHLRNCRGGLTGGTEGGGGWFFILEATPCLESVRVF